MDKYTIAEEAYKKGREDAIEKISDAIWDYVSCSYCPAECNDNCYESLADWMRGLFEGDVRKIRTTEENATVEEVRDESNK